MKGIKSNFSNAFNIVMNTRIARLILLCVFLSIYVVGVVSLVITIYSGFGIVSNTKILVQEKNKIVVKEIQSDGYILLQDDTKVKAKDVKNTYPITSMSKTYYIKDKGLFLPVEKGGLRQFQYEYIYLILLFVFTLMILKEDQYMKDGGIKILFFSIYCIMLVLEVIGYNLTFESYLESRDSLVKMSFIQSLFLFLRLYFLANVSKNFILTKGSKLGTNFSKK